MSAKIDIEKKIEVAKACHLFFEKHLTVTNDGGDISMRDPNTGYIYICPRANERHIIPNWGMVSPMDIVVVDIDGNMLEDTYMRPTIEAAMHYGIYKSKPDINAIVHSHAVYSSVFAACGKNIPACLVESAPYGGECVCAEYGRVASKELAENVVKALGRDKKCALLRNHGAVACGKNFRDAFSMSDYLEKVAQVALLTYSMGQTPISLDVKDIKDPSLI